MISIEYIFLVLLLNFLVVLVAVYFIKKGIKDIEQANEGRYTYLGTMAEKNETDITNLYKKDRHGTLRPKVDILEDKINEASEKIWGELQKHDQVIYEPEYDEEKK